MCELCNGTYVVHENNSLGSRFSGCPDCGPEPADVQNARLQKLKDRKVKKKEEASIDQS
jgi:hypothetical protein